MQPFDCLSRDCPLLGPHLLEASAGTGKTFSIEHIFVRLLLEKVDLKNILAVTFTRAATREMKKRIRSNIQKALEGLLNGQIPWDYLHIAPADGVFLLKSALETFDEAQIFTLHGFCCRMLQEFAFEAGLFPLPPLEENRGVPKKLKIALVKFLKEEMPEDLLCFAQMAQWMKHAGSMKELQEALLKSNRYLEPACSFRELKKKWDLLCPDLEEEKLLHDFTLLAPNYKKKKGDFLFQIKTLAQKNLADLLLEEGSIFSFLSPVNQKVKTRPVSGLHYPSFFEWAYVHLYPLIQQAIDPERIFSIAAHHWHLWAETLYEEEAYFRPDDFLYQMKKALQNPVFETHVRKKYDAVIIDEFQDTDPLQWEIFQKIFLDENKRLKALFLVGDPKQSIYRFRKADVYTYFHARTYLGPSHLYHLTTNFRSSSELLEVINALFHRNWLRLPKIGQTIPYHPVQAGLSEKSPLSDGKGAVHFVDGSPLALWPYAVQEIERLYSQTGRYGSFAILVKDRYQANEAFELLQKRNIPVQMRKSIPIGKTEAFKAIRELLKAIEDPSNGEKARAVSWGPFEGTIPLESLEDKGIGFLAQQVLKPTLPFYLDARHIFEELLLWEQKKGFSWESLHRFLDELQEKTPEEGGACRMEEMEDAVQVLTLHISKGLEFDVVFAWGLAFSSKETDEELDAEKLRQLYVAVTRAKYRLYLPMPVDSRSAVALFSQCIEEQEKSFREYLQTLSRTHSVTMETLSDGLEVISKPSCVTEDEPSKPTLWPFSPRYLHSFTSLSTSFPEGTDLSLFTEEDLPLGNETGIFFHLLFEKLFSGSETVWKSSTNLKNWIEQQLQFSPFKKWKTRVYNLIEKTFTTPLFESFVLRDLSSNEVVTEMEFLFQGEKHVFQGCVDLIFCKHSKYYILDWKTNWIGNKPLNQIMDEHDYWLQASLYAEALNRWVGKEVVGGAVYFFVRTSQFLHFMPKEFHGN